jgi:hypothetical protein
MTTWRVLVAAEIDQEVVTSLLEVKLLCVGVNLIGVESFVHLLPSATFGNVLFTLLLASCLWSSDIDLDGNSA